MPALKPSAKTQVIPQLVQVFRQYGYEGATLSRIASATGLGRASLYHHFPQGKQGMAAAVLDHISTVFSEIILQPLQNTGEPSVRLEAMSQGIAQFYNQGRQGCFLAIFSLGDAGELFAERNQQAFKTWIGAIETVLVEAGLAEAIAQQRAEAAVMQIQGGLIVSQGLGDTEPFLQMLAMLPEQLLATVSPLHDS